MSRTNFTVFRDRARRGRGNAVSGPSDPPGDRQGIHSVTGDSTMAAKKKAAKKKVAKKKAAKKK
jgi:hypothetical protein